MVRPGQTDNPGVEAMLLYVHDPMCSWCWAFVKPLQALQGLLPDHIVVRRLLGGLAPDTDAPMDAAMRDYLQATWRRIELQIPGTRFNFDYWGMNSPRRQTWPACRAVIAARSIDHDAEQVMIESIQSAYYEQARDPSDPVVLADLAAEIGLPRQNFEMRCRRPETQFALETEIAQSRTMGVDSFPSLRLAVSGKVLPVPVDYRDAAAMKDTIDGLLESA